MLNKCLRTAAVLAASAMLLNMPYAPEKCIAEASGLTDSGIDYTETVGTISNPAAGYTNTVWANCAPGSTEVYDPHGSFVLFFIDIGAFSSGINGKEDYDLDETFFNAWRQTLNNCRKNGSMVGMRFRYDAVGTANPEPASFDKILDHIDQIKESRILEDNRDIICLIESGFVGKWGEQHGGKYTEPADKAKLLDALIKAVPDNIPITVRTPDTFAEWVGIKRSQLMDEELRNAAALSSADQPVNNILCKRVGIYDDGYMGSDSDLGTYSDRKTETDWISSVTDKTYFGGEFSGNLEYAFKFDTYLPENSIKEMYKTHLSYINSNIFQKYKDFTFDEKCDAENVDNSAYYGESVFQFIRDHIGYRFVLRQSELTPETVQGGELDLHFKVENTGFANPVPDTHTCVILENNGVYIKVPVDVNCNEWYSRTVIDNSVKLHIPDSIAPGEWKVYLNQSMGIPKNEFEELPLRSIRFANNDVWNAKLGANYLGTVSIKHSDNLSGDNSLYEITQNGNGIGSCDYLLTDPRTVIDGKITSKDEWTEDMKVADNGKGQSIYVKADEKYLYVMSTMPETAQAPVYNLSLVNPQLDNERYWLYYESGGFVYFNHSSKEDFDCKWNGNIVEFRVTLNTYNLKAGDTVNNLRVFLQDSANNWIDLGDITAASAVVPSGIAVYTAKHDIRLTSGSSHTINVYSPLFNDASYQWYKDDSPIEGATDTFYTIKAASEQDLGSYSLRITAQDRIDTVIPAANVIEVSDLHPLPPGDANCDGEVDMSDVVIVMQCCLNPKKYDVNGLSDDRITEKGRLLANVDGTPGISTNDALLIQKFTLKLINSLTNT